MPVTSDPRRQTSDWRLETKKRMIKLLQSSWAASILGALLYLGTTVSVWRSPSVAVTADDPVVTGKPSWDFHNPEVDLLIEELKQEKEALTKRQAQLNELDERLQAERLEINLVTQSLSQMQAQFDTNVVRLLAEEASNVKKLAKTYAAMTPEGAATIMKQLEETTLVKILACMKESETAPILEAMAGHGEVEAKRVADISERLRLTLSIPKDGQRTPP